MKKINFIKSIFLFAIIGLFISACSKEEFIDPLPESNIDLSLFGACFERVLTTPSSMTDTLRSEIDTLVFPTIGDGKSFDAFRITNRNVFENGIRSVEAKLKKSSYTERIDGIDYFRQGSELTFKFNISSTSDITNDTPFSRDALLQFLIIGKKFQSTTDSVGTIEMAYSCVDKIDDSFCFQDFEMGGFSSYIFTNFVVVESIEDFMDTDYDGNVLSNGLKVDLTFEFLGTIDGNIIPCEFYGCELNNGKATVYLPYE
jgi:hypothetical protein